MNSFEFCSPTRIVLGKDAELQTGGLIRKYGGERVLLHYGGKHAKESGLIDRVADSIKKADLYLVEFGGVVPNPRLELVRKGIKVCKENNIDFIIAVGGGSVIDSAKAIAMGLKYDGDVWDLFMEDDGIVRGEEKEHCVPVGVVLTIAATGSEASNSCVITDEENCLKRFCDNDLHRPVFAIENPELMLSLPTFQTACGIVDIMSHSMERYFCPAHFGNDLTDHLCEAIFKTCLECGRKLMLDPNNYDARANIMLASTISHNGLTGMGRENGGDWCSHFIEHELSGEYDVTHGAGLAVIIPAWMKYVWKRDPVMFIKWATRVMGVETDYENTEAVVLEGIRRTESFFHSLGLPTTMSAMPDVGIVSEETMYKMAKRVRITNNNGTVGGFMQLDTEDIVNIFKLAQ